MKCEWCDAEAQHGCEVCGAPVCDLDATRAADGTARCPEHGAREAPER